MLSSIMIYLIYSVMSIPLQHSSAIFVSTQSRALEISV